ncbi:hypothetical protein ACHQM5_006757 [Ranunculus cassubicifolius]
MAFKLNVSLFSSFLVLVVLFSMIQTMYAGRETPTTTNGKDVPLTTQTIPGFQIPRIPYPRYVPGLDDTFIPNPGYEIPIPQATHVDATARP